MGVAAGSDEVVPTWFMQQADLVGLAEQPLFLDRAGMAEQVLEMEQGLAEDMEETDPFSVVAGVVVPQAMKEMAVVELVLPGRVVVAAGAILIWGVVSESIKWAPAVRRRILAKGGEAPALEVLVGHMAVAQEGEITKQTAERAVKAVCA